MENNNQNGYINGNAAVGSAAPAAAPAAPANAVQTPVTDNTAQFAAPAAKGYEKPQNTVPYAVIERPAPEKGASGLGFNIVSMCIGIISLITSLSCIKEAVTILLGDAAFGSYSNEASIISQAVVLMITSIIALVFAVIGLKNKQNPGRGMGVSGIICSIFALLISGSALIIAALVYAELLI